MDLKKTYSNIVNACRLLLGTDAMHTINIIEVYYEINTLISL